MPLRFVERLAPDRDINFVHCLGVMADEGLGDSGRDTRLVQKSGRGAAQGVKR